MLVRVVAFALHHRVVVLMLAAVLLVGGAVAVGTAPWDVFPEFAPPQIVVQTEAAGLTTEEVERLVTVPVESALNGVSRVRTLRSSSVPGLSVVTAIFEEGIDILDARQVVSERLAEIRDALPEAAESPRMTPLAASTSRLLMVGLTSDSIGLMELRRIAEWTFARRLRSVQGVASVEVFGGRPMQYQVLVDPQRLQQYRIGLHEIVDAARSATGFGGAGFIETENQRLPVRQRTEIESAADLATAPVLVEQDGAVITLGQVTDIAIGPADAAGDATINGRPGVLLVIHKQPFFNTLTVTAGVQEALDSLASGLPEAVELHTELFRQATFIERAIGNLTVAIVIGSVLVTLVLIAFLFQWRTLAISLTAIPLSLFGAILVLRAFGASLNAMTLGGLAIALGEVVDDAIVDVENVLRRLRENCRLASPRPALLVVLDASLEVRSAVVYASFIVILVFVPVFFMGGLAGTFFRPLGLAYVAAIVASLAVALTVTPAMCLLLLRTRARAGAGADDAPPLVRTLKRAYARLFSLVMNHPRSALLTSTALLAAAVAVVPQLGGEFLPDFRESNFVVFMVGKPDMSLPEAIRAGEHVARRLRGIPGVASVAQQVGRAELSEDTWGPNISEVWVALNEGADYERVLAEIRESLEGVPGYAFQVKQFVRERIDEVLTGARSDIVIAVAGPELDELRRYAAMIAAAIEAIAGVADLQVEQQVEVPQVEIAVRPRDAAGYGFSAGALNEAVRTLVAGRVVGQVYEGEAVLDVVVRAHPAARCDPHALARLVVETPAGDWVPLEAVAVVRTVEGPNIINRENGARRILVTCNAQGRDVAGVVRDIRRTLDDARTDTPPGYRIEYAGEYEAKSAAQQRLLLLSAAVLIGIFVLLHLDFRRADLALMVMLSVPFAWVGGVAAVLLAGGDVSLGSLVGFVTVFGVAVRNGILLISHFEHLHQQERVPIGRELLLRGAQERLAPILMTALTTALALLPLIVAGNLPGHEIEHPMAVVIVGGLVTSTLLNLFVVPVIYLVFRRSRGLGFA